MNSSQMLTLAVQHHQAGNFGEAETLYRKILQAEPRNPDALHLLGVIACRFEKHQLAVELIRSALRERPTMAPAYCNLGTSLQALGQLDEAVASYRRALHLNPDYAVAHCNLGNALRNQDKPAEALACYQRSLQLRPDDAGTLTNMGVALQRLGRTDEAIACQHRAIRQMPTNADAHINLGSVLQEQGKPEEAVVHYEQALRLKPDHVDALTNLGLALLALGKIDEAIARQEQALRLKPNFAPAHNNLGAALVQQGKLQDAAASYAQALKLKPGFADAYRNLGRLQQNQGKLDEALATYQQVLRLQPDSAMSQCDIGNVLQDLADFEGAEQAYRAALRLDPGNVDALWGLAVQLRGKLPDADRATLENRLLEPKPINTDPGKVHFALAQVCDAKGEYELAASHLKKANALQSEARRKQGKAYLLEENARFVDAMVATFTPEFFERVRGFGLETKVPVFIVGMPRSGTTLTEQILAAHSRAFGAGELFLSQDDFQALGKPPKAAFAALADLRQETVRGLAQRHLDQLASYDRRAERIVDKMPDNYLYVGLLAALFPRATFIHCRRDLRDTALSCWLNPLPSPWTNSPEHIAARIREYQRLMEYWRAVLPTSMLEVDYEETVADLPSVARRLVEFCGLEWEEACLKFNEGDRHVRTASKVQVREPVHTRSVGRWRHYERELSELFAALTPLQEKGC
jgi:tetratricopeptide (TPR) repeat protein